MSLGGEDNLDNMQSMRRTSVGDCTKQVGWSQGEEGLVNLIDGRA